MHASWHALVARKGRQIVAEHDRPVEVARAGASAVALHAEGGRGALRLHGRKF